ncbi:MAG: DNA-binding response regulator [Candidatus Hydrogenedentota bacterium]|nr:MAG: DNA-binding response regulator [Candidatus Hydrogenedentota bacterium]
MSKTPKIVIADDHEVFRYGLRKLLEENGMDVVAEAGNGEQLVDILEDIDCNIVITDLSMPKLGGIEAIRVLKNRFPGLKIIVLSMHKDKPFVRKVLAEDVDAYILKDDIFEEIIRSIKNVMQGRKAYSADLLSTITEEYNALQDAKVRLDLLTPREKEILIMIGNGMTNKEMAEQLGISVRTVETHRANLMEKMEFQNSQEAIRFAIEMDLV